MTREEVLQYIAPKELGVLPQVRTHQNSEADAGLMLSLKEVGMLHPVRARREDGKPIVVDGHRRVAAAIAIGLERIPVIFEDGSLGEAAVVQRQLVANCQREDLTPLEKANAIHRLIEATDWSAVQVAAKLGLSPASVSKLLPLRSLPEGIIKQIEAGKIPASAAYELSRVDNAGQQAELAQQLADGRLTRDGLAGSNRAAKKRAATRTAASKALRVTAMLGASRSVTVASSDLTLERFIEVIEELLAKARRVRTQGVELPTFIKMLKDQARAE